MPCGEPRSDQGQRLTLCTYTFPTMGSGRWHCAACQAVPHSLRNGLALLWAQTHSVMEAGAGPGHLGLVSDQLGEAGLPPDRFNPNTGLPGFFLGSLV